jgi:hypothetical protein
MLDRKGKGGDDLSTETIKGVFEAQLRQVDKYLQDHDNFKTIYVNYNEMINDPKPTITAVNEFLGGSLDTKAMAGVVEPGLYRQRQT